MLNGIQLSKNNMFFYLIGFILTETLIFYKGLTVWFKLYLINNYFMYLIIVSVVFLVGIGVIFFNQFKKNNQIH